MPKNSGHFILSKEHCWFNLLLTGCHLNLDWIVWGMMWLKFPICYESVDICTVNTSRLPERKSVIRIYCLAGSFSGISIWGLSVAGLQIIYLII
jgi:hypothetical protein